MIDTATTPPTAVKMELTRRDAREYVRWQSNADLLRIRRARVTLYAT